jgi:two-component sensor histidine kinase
MDSLQAIFETGSNDSIRYAAAVAIMENISVYEPALFEQWMVATAPFAKKYPDQVESVQRNLLKALDHRINSDYVTAYSLAMDCVSRFKAMNRQDLVCQGLFEAGSSLSEYNAEGSFALFQEGIDLAKSIQREDLALNCLVNLAYAIEKTALRDQLYYVNTLREALDIARRIKNAQAILVLNYHLVEHFCKKKQFEKARESIQEVKELVPTIGMEVFDAYPLQLNAILLNYEGRHQEALAEAQKSWDLMVEYGELEGQYEAYPLIIELFEKTGQYEQAFRFFSNFQAIKDSTFTEEKNRTVQNLQTKYETAKKETQIEQQQAALARSRLEKWALALGLAILAFLAFLFWRQRQKTIAAYQEIAISNAQIQKQNEQLDLLMRELHHRVKNNLQMVSSLLRLQSRQIGDEHAAAAIKSGQLRVEAMSLIHQQLYQEEGITLVNMQLFAVELSEKIAFAFGWEPGSIDFLLRFEPAEVDVDKAMPLSLILNELLTNSFKYAFDTNTYLPSIAMRLENTANGLRFYYSDNGPGLPSGIAHKASFGTKLIASLSGQLGATWRQWNDKGAHFEMLMKA